MKSLKIMHISDLHLCEASVLEKIKPIFEAFDNFKEYLIPLGFNFGDDIKLEYADEERMLALIEAVKQHKPDHLLITGDITTFGDAKSFTEAKDFIGKLKAETKDKNKSMIFTVPGNHDVLCSQFLALKDKLQSLLKQVDEKKVIFGVKGDFFISRVPKLKKIRNQLKELISIMEEALSNDDIKSNQTEIFKNYRDFVDSTSCQRDAKYLESPEKDIKVLCQTINSVSQNPLLINLGISNEKTYLALLKERDRSIIDQKSLSESVSIVLLHHNPISSPTTIDSVGAHAYNSMPSGSSFLKGMQDENVDLVLYGHQHEHACVEIDFLPSKPGHIYLIGAPSATMGKNAGFNIIDIFSRYSARVDQYEIVNHGIKYNKVMSIDLSFEKERINDLKTITTRKEIRQYEHEGNSEYWKGIFSPQFVNHELSNTNEYFFVGPRQKGLDDEDLINLLKAIKSGSKVKVLISDPKLYSIVKKLDNEKDIQIMNEIWDEHHMYSWNSQAIEAAKTINRIQDLVYQKLEPSDRKNLELRLSHTLMSIGARGKNIDKENGYLLIRLLPIGVFQKFKRPLLKLEERDHEAIYSFYKKYIDELWGKATPVDWTSDKYKKLAMAK